MKDKFFSEETIREILHDADCPIEFAQEFLETGNVVTRLQMLRRQRKRQLERIHAEEKKLDILDFLRDKLEQPRAV